MLAFSSFFFFVFKIRKEDIMTSVNRERKDIPLLYARLPEGKIRKGWWSCSPSFSFPVSERKEEKTFRHSFCGEERREEDAKQGFSFSFLFFVFCWRKEEDIRPRNGKGKASSLFLLSLFTWMTSCIRPFLLLSFPFSFQTKSLPQGEEGGNEIMQRKIPSGAKDGIWRDTIAHGK